MYHSRQYGKFTVLTPITLPMIDPMLEKHLASGAVIYYLCEDPVFFEDTEKLWNVLREMQKMGGAPTQCRLMMQDVGMTENRQWADNVVSMWQNNGGGPVLWCKDFESALKRQMESLERYPLYEFEKVADGT